MELLKGIALGLWTNHRKKLLAFVFGLLFAGLAAITDIPLDEIKQAAGEAAKQPTVTQPLIGPALPATPAEVKAIETPVGVKPK